ADTPRGAMVGSRPRGTAGSPKDLGTRRISTRPPRGPSADGPGRAAGEADVPGRVADGPGWVADGSGWPADGLVGSAERAPAGFCVPTAERRRSREVSGLMRRLLR